MTMKFVEIRDRNTFIPALAFDISSDDGYYARRSGFKSRMVVLVSLHAARCETRCELDPYAWVDRTFRISHLWLEEHWDTFVSGCVVDVEFILGETAVPKASERETVPA
jgi:hypothetical protein